MVKLYDYMMKKLEFIKSKNQSDIINSIHDKVILSMLEDSSKYNDEPLRLIEKQIFNPKTKKVQFNVRNQ